jgi:geranylgeranyl pyrophosphate synthase
VSRSRPLTCWDFLAVDKASSSEEEREEKPEPEWNARTIRPFQRSGSTSSVESIANTPSNKAKSHVEDYSDLAGDEDEAQLLEKVADFKVSSNCT